MSWRERVAAKADARAAVHDHYKIPVMFSPDNGVNWRTVFCRFHEDVNPDGVRLGAGTASVNISTSKPRAIFRAFEVPDIVRGTSIVSVAPGKAYSVSGLAPEDLFGYRAANLEYIGKNPGYPVPDWESL